MNKLFCLICTLFSLLPFSEVGADEPLPSVQGPKRIAVVCMFPNNVLYIDQGFASFTRNKVEVKKQAPTFEAILKTALEKKFAEKGITQVSFVFLPPTLRSDLVKNIESSVMFDSWESIL